MCNEWFEHCSSLTMGRVIIARDWEDQFSDRTQRLFLLECYVGKLCDKDEKKDYF